MHIKYLKIDLINLSKSHKKVEMNINNNQHHHKTKIDNIVHPFKATSPPPLQRENVFIKKIWKILIQSQMVIFATEWILPGRSTRLHDPGASFGSEFGEKLALLGPIEYSVLLYNLHKIIILHIYHKFQSRPVGKVPKFIEGRSWGQTPTPPFSPLESEISLAYVLSVGAI